MGTHNQGEPAMHKSSDISTDQKLALRMNEAVVISGIGRSSLYKAIGAKQLRAVKIGRSRLILREDLLTFLRGVQQ
jgi:excisionase family DNA binding protein